MSVRRCWLVVTGVGFVTLASLLAMVPDRFGDVQYETLFVALRPHVWALVLGVVGVYSIHTGYVGWVRELRQRLAHALVSAVYGVWAAGVWLSIPSEGTTPPTAPVFLAVLATMAVVMARSDLDSHRETHTDGTPPTGP